MTHPEHAILQQHPPAWFWIGTVIPDHQCGGLLYQSVRAICLDGTRGRAGDPWMDFWSS